MFWLKKDWDRISRQVSVSKQENFLKDSFKLFKSYPFYYTPLYAVLSLLVVVNAFIGNKVGAFYISLCLLVLYIVNLVIYFYRFKALEDKYYR